MTVIIMMKMNAGKEKGTGVGRRDAEAPMRLKVEQIENKGAVCGKGEGAWRREARGPRRKKEGQKVDERPERFRTIDQSQRRDDRGGVVRSLDANLSCFAPTNRDMAIFANMFKVKIKFYLQTRTQPATLPLFRKAITFFENNRREIEEYKGTGCAREMHGRKRERDEDHVKSSRPIPSGRGVVALRTSTANGDYRGSPRCTWRLGGQSDLEGCGMTGSAFYSRERFARSPAREGTGSDGELYCWPIENADSRIPARKDQE
ncbi:hypothetical protein DBV15_01039 [Temnothorax longispinosus]|uniref:Uncharacterized protein n=1 Tax=Temnothorax longispinosus TaxID=300112 RepID=A0A4S2J9W7_9HYME|nr:hypothetical protein DBV15_01039 [Temnothorax longispinosus]